jgi:xanthine dehydrogenase iron-sulfur cluster and FAD-binding subunit A
MVIYKNICFQWKYITIFKPSKPLKISIITVSNIARLSILGPFPPPLYFIIKTCVKSDIKNNKTIILLSFFLQYILIYRLSGEA